MIELHRLGIGKPFAEAAKESIKLQQSYHDLLNSNRNTPSPQNNRSQTPY